MMMSNGKISSYYVKVYEKEGEATYGSTGYKLVEERIHDWEELDTVTSEGNCKLEMYAYDSSKTNGHVESLGEKVFEGTDKRIDTNCGVWTHSVILLTVILLWQILRPEKIISSVQSSLTEYLTLTATLLSIKQMRRL